MTAITNLPDLRPSLLLDFANSGRVDPRIQCTRPSSATCFGPDGKLRTVAPNVPRIDYDPVTGKRLGLLVEEARTNLFTYSADITNAVWGKTNLSLDGSKISVGSADFYKLSEIFTAQPAGKNVRRMFPSAYPAGTALSIKWFFIEGTRRFCNVVILAAGVLASIALDTKTGDFGIRHTGLPGWTWTVVKHLTGVIEVVAKNPSIHAEYPTGSYIDMRPVTAASLAEAGSIGETYTGDTSQYVYIGPIQLELGAFPTSYIPTEAAAVTRAADVITLPGVSVAPSWTVVSEQTLAGFPSFSTLWSLDSPTAGVQSNIRLLATSAGNNRPEYSENGSSNNITWLNISTGTESARRTALASNGSILRMAINGVATADGAVATKMQAAPNLRFGLPATSANGFTGRFARLSIYPSMLSADHIRRLTA